MSFDLYLVPGTDFLGWGTEQIEMFVNREPPPESEQLGGSTYIGTVMDAVSALLEGGEPGSKFPLLWRLDMGDPPGWYESDLVQLREELSSARAGLAQLTVDRVAAVFGDQQGLQEFIAAWRCRRGGREPDTVASLFDHFFDTFLATLGRAGASGQGLLVLC